jgi:hypothetical protein
MFGKSTEPKGVVIARLEGSRSGATVSASQVFLLLGLIAMVAAWFVADTAIKLAAYGAIWTGWNVLCGISILSERRTDYIVYREISPELARGPM